MMASRKEIPPNHVGQVADGAAAKAARIVGIKGWRKGLSLTHRRGGKPNLGKNPLTLPQVTTMMGKPRLGLRNAAPLPGRA